MPKFFSDEERKDIKSFFEFEDGVVVKLKMKFRKEPAKEIGKKDIPCLDCINVDTKEEFTLKYQYGLMAALDEMPEYLEGDIIEVTPNRLKKPDGSFDDRVVGFGEAEKRYKQFDFAVKNLGKSEIPF